MTTIPGLLSDIRADLKDTTSQKKWTDEDLYRWVKDAFADYSQYFPYRVDRYQLTLTSGSYPLPANFVREISVECPKDTYLEKRLVRPGQVYRSTTSPKFYHIDGGRLYLSASSADDVLLTYRAVHAVPAIDSSTALTIPDMDLELIRLFASGKAHGQMRAKQARLDRFDDGAGRRDDNPLTPEVNLEMRDYRARIYERMRGGVITLYRPGRER